MRVIFSKDIARYFWYHAAMLHMSQPYVGAAFWRRNCLTPAKISQEFPYWKGGWLMLGFTWSPQQLLHHYAKVKDPYEKRNSVSCYKSPIQNTCFLFWVLLPTFSVTFLKAHHLSLLQFPSHPFPYASCELFDDIVIQRNFKHLHCFSKTFFSVQTFSTSHTTYHPGKPRRNQEVVHCGRLCIRLHVAVDIPVLLQLDPKSTEVEELYFTSAQTSL